MEQEREKESNKSLQNHQQITKCKIKIKMNLFDLRIEFKKKYF